MLGTYAATKHGVLGLSEAARAELRGTGVEVSVVMPYFVRTELTAGVPDARGLRRLAPEDVAAAVVAALERPRFDVYLPRRAGVLIKLGGTLPRRLRDVLARAFKADEALERTDLAARAGYEARAAASAPAAEEERSAVT
jgi:short-subunit dehydrogenase